MKKVTALLFAVLSILFFSSGVYGQDITVSAGSAVLIEADTGKILYGKNEDEFRAMASTTKIMSALLCLESGGLDEEFVVDSEAIKVEGSSMGLVEGDIVTKRALCCGMLLPSGNDSANAAAVAVAGSIPDFVDMMNERADEMGLEKTHFVTPSGLDGEGHGSTAYEMALLAAEALKNPDFLGICSQECINLSFGNPPYNRSLYNTNKLLSDESCIGVKTGFTDEAGRCLVSAFEKDGVRLICVTLNAPDDWNDHRKLYDYGFSVVSAKTVGAKRIVVPVVGGNDDEVVLVSDECSVPVFDGAENYETKVIVPPFLYAPVTDTSSCGRIEYYVDGVLIDSSELRPSCNVDIYTEEITFFSRIMSFFG